MLEVIEKYRIFDGENSCSETAQEREREKQQKRVFLS